MNHNADGCGGLVVHVGDIPIDVLVVGRALTAKRQARHCASWTLSKLLVAP